MGSDGGSGLRVYTGLRVGYGFRLKGIFEHNELNIMILFTSGLRVYGFLLILKSSNGKAVEPLFIVKY